MNSSAEIKGKKVLIVEDEESNFELLRAMLGKNKFLIDWARTGREAITYCVKERYDLILMDIKMPEMNGYDAFKRLREMKVDAPIIAQTAYARLEDEEKTIEMGFNGYISKPINRDKLADMINRYL